MVAHYESMQAQLTASKDAMRAAYKASLAMQASLVELAAQITALEALMATMPI